MTRTYTVWICIIFSCLFFTFSNGEKQVSKLELFFKSLNLKSEGDYKTILISQKHKPNRVAPKLIRDFMVNLRPIRLSFSAGVRYKDKKISFRWFFSEFAVKGGEDKTVSSINQLLSKHQFFTKKSKLNKYGNYEHHFYKQNSDIYHHFWIEGPERFVGSRESMCGGMLSYEITYQKTIPQPTVNEILDIYPEIACPELPKDIYNYLKDKKFLYIDYGGPWHHYYDWSVAILSDEKESAKESFANHKTFKLLIKLLKITPLFAKKPTIA